MSALKNLALKAVKWQLDSSNRLVLLDVVGRNQKRQPRTFSIEWILDHQKSNWHSLTQQKIEPASSLTKDVVQRHAVDSVVSDGAEVHVVWKDKSLKPSILTWKDLELTTNNSSRYGLPVRTPWKSLKTLPSSSYTSKTSHRQMLQDLSVYGVHLVTNMPSTTAETETFIRSRLGPPRETFYGGMWDTAPRKENINDTAYTYDALDPHTDTCYLIDSPGLQCFNCVAQDAGSGGKTRIVDAEMVVSMLRDKHIETFNFFSSTELVFHHTEKGLHARVSAPAIALEKDGGLKQFRYNEYDLAPLNYLPLEVSEKFYQHNGILQKVIKDCEHHIKLSVGEMLLIDNHRVMHGRTAFKGYRNLIGCYVGADDWIMRARAEFAATQ